MSQNKPRGPVLLELDDTPASPAEAALVPDLDLPTPQGRTMQVVAGLAARKPSKLWRFFWLALLSLLTAAISVAAWDFVFALFERNIWFGRAVTLLLATLVISAGLLALREWLAFARLRRVDGLRKQLDAAWASPDLKIAQDASTRLTRFYRHRADQRWALQNLNERQGEVVDADALLALTETSLMQPLDEAARREIEAAARQVATITAIVPMAMVDVITALTANLRMVRRIAETYGGRAGTFGSWRLLRNVMVHLVATGAVSIGDDLIGSILGGGLMSKISRRFGEGVINGALTARVGIAAMEVCRPMPFKALQKPKVTTLVRRALTGLFGAK